MRLETQKPKTSACHDYIAKLEKALPELASTSDLVKAGIYRNAQAAYTARRRKDCPAYMDLPCRGIVYPRKGVCEYLLKHCVENL